MSRAARPDPPKALGAAGKRVWRATIRDLAEGWELDARELEMLRRAARCADELEALEKVVDRDGMPVKGSRGQTVVHPAQAEARQVKLALARLLGHVELADPKRQPTAGTTASQRGSHAAAARWAS